MSASRRNLEYKLESPCIWPSAFSGLVIFTQRFEHNTREARLLELLIRYSTLMVSVLVWSFFVHNIGPYL
jgi:hypothetical protein